MHGKMPATTSQRPTGITVSIVVVLFLAALVLSKSLWSAESSVSAPNEDKLRHGASTPVHVDSRNGQPSKDLPEQLAKQILEKQDSIGSQLSELKADMKANTQQILNAQVKKSTQAQAPAVITQDVAPSKTTTGVAYAVDCGPDHSCYSRGTCYIGKCFCDPGATGPHCKEGLLKDCASIASQADRLTCFFHPEFGSARVDEATWRKALAAESGVWAGDAGSNDRSDEHTRGYGGFKVFTPGQDLGMFAEFGCGPWTQTKTSLHQARPDVKFTSILLSDPNLHNYVQNVPACSYKSGTLLPGVTTYLVAAGAEAPVFHEAFDTVMMTNVLEHVQNAYAVLHNLWHSLKPGGILIFNDRWVEDFPFHSHVELNNVLHPVRVRKPVLEWLLSHFDTMFRNDDGTAEMKSRGDIGIYFIGRKKAPGSA